MKAEDEDEAADGLVNCGGTVTSQRRGGASRAGRADFFFGRGLWNFASDGEWIWRDCLPVVGRGCVVLILCHTSGAGGRDGAGFEVPSGSWGTGR